MTHSTARRRHRQRQRGATILEAAIALPIVIVLCLGMVDFGWAELRTSQATSAARDGARVAILDATSTDRIRSAVRARVTNMEIPDSAIQVACLDGLTGSTTIPCSTVVADQDRVRVTVRWAHAALSPFSAVGGVRDIVGVATMVYLDEPVQLGATTTTTSTTTTTVQATTSTTTTPDPSGPTPTTLTPTTTTPITAPPAPTTTNQGTCGVVSVTFDPPTNEISGSKNLDHDVDVTVVTNNAATCTRLRIEYSTGRAVHTESLTAAGAAWTNNIGTNEYDWNAGTHTFRVLTASGDLVPNGEVHYRVDG